MNIEKIMSSLEAKHPGESEYLQAVKEVLLSIEDIYNQHPEFEKAKIIERLVEPDGYINYVKGANIAGFMKVAHAMMGQGII